MNLEWRSPEHWVEVHGRWDFDSEGNPIYLGDSLGTPFRYGLCLCDGRITQGTIRVKVRIPDEFAEARILFGYSTQDRTHYAAGIGGWDNAFSIQQFRPDLGLVALKRTGLKDNIKTRRDYNLSVTLRGSRIVLSIDGVDILEHVLVEPLEGEQIGLFTIEDQKVEFSEFEYSSERGEVFVVMQFSEPYKSLYKEVIKPIVESFKLSAYHAGEVYGPGMGISKQKGEKFHRNFKKARVYNRLR